VRMPTIIVSEYNIADLRELPPRETDAERSQVLIRVSCFSFSNSHPLITTDALASASNGRFSPSSCTRRKDLDRLRTNVVVDISERPATARGVIPLPTCGASRGSENAQKKDWLNDLLCASRAINSPQVQSHKVDLTTGKPNKITRDQMA
jgi:hypothetical protein